jgi:hypothetical protein
MLLCMLLCMCVLCVRADLLQWKCEHELAGRLGMDTVFLFLKLSAQFKDDFGRSIALRLVKDNYQEFIVNKEVCSLRLRSRSRSQ